MHEDFSDSVRMKRRELGKRLVEARNNGEYAKISFDKLIIENEVFKYDETRKDIVRIGYARRRKQPNTQEHVQAENSDSQSYEGDPSVATQRSQSC